MATAAEVTIDTVRATEQMLRERLVGLNATLEQEREARAAFRLRVQEKAHALGIENSRQEGVNHIMSAMGLELCPVEVAVMLRAEYVQRIPNPQNLRMEGDAEWRSASLVAGWWSGDPTINLHRDFAITALLHVSPMDDCWCDEWFAISEEVRRDRILPYLPNLPLDGTVTRRILHRGCHGEACKNIGSGGTVLSFA